MIVLPPDGYYVLRHAVDPRAVTDARRLLNLHIRREGLTAEQIRYCQATTFFPNLRNTSVIWNLLPPLVCAEPGEEWAEPQILIRFPDEEKVADYPVIPHMDTEPPWANGRKYKAIVGVNLTDTGERDGALHVWPGSHAGERSKPIPVPMNAGDAVVFDPKLLHAGSPNLGPDVRMAVYFRLLGAA